MTPELKLRAWCQLYGWHLMFPSHGQSAISIITRGFIEMRDNYGFGPFGGTRRDFYFDTASQAIDAISEWASTHKADALP